MQGSFEYKIEASAGQVALAIDLDALSDTGRWLAHWLGRETGSKVTRARSVDP